MGTPGDQKAFVKLNPEFAIIEQPEKENPETKSTKQTEPNMTVIARTKPLTNPSQSTKKQDQQLSKQEQPNIPEATIITQAKIDEFFFQTKNYSNPSSEQEGEQSSTNIELSEPGPSGYQKEQDPSKKLTKSSSKKSYSCNVCLRTFSSLGKLEKHSLSHGNVTESSPFKCEQCKKTFNTKFKLVRHVLIHSDQKQFSCVVCERTFHRKDHLKNHVKVHSPCKTLYVCRKSDCKKEYTSHLSYRKHVAVHAAEEGSLMCQMCSKTFETKEEILYHLKVHAGSRSVKSPNEKKFTCDSCDRRFFTRKDVRRHMVVHTGMRDFLCQFCPQRFGRKDHLVRHIKKSHSKLQSKPETEVKGKSEEPVYKLSEEVLKLEPSEIPFFKPLDIVLENVAFKSLDSGPSTSFLEPKSDSTSFKTSDSIEVIIKEEEQADLIPNPTPIDVIETPFEESNVYLENLFPFEQENELKDLGSQVLKDIGDSPIDLPHEELATTSLDTTRPVDETNFLDLIGQTENLPLPGFVQTFQNPPQGQ